MSEPQASNGARGDFTCASARTHVDNPAASAMELALALAVTDAPRVPWAVTRRLLSDPLRYVGPVEEGSAGPWNKGARNETAMAPFWRR